MMSGPTHVLREIEAALARLANADVRTCARPPLPVRVIARSSPVKPGDDSEFLAPTVPNTVIARLDRAIQ
jgi:hypothetical protein